MLAGDPTNEQLKNESIISFNNEQAQSRDFKGVAVTIGCKQILWFEHGGGKVTRGEEERNQKGRNSDYFQGMWKTQKIDARRRMKMLSAVLILKPSINVFILGPFTAPHLLYLNEYGLRGWARRTKNTVSKKKIEELFLFLCFFFLLRIEVQRQAEFSGKAKASLILQDSVMWSCKCLQTS